MKIPLLIGLTAAVTCAQSAPPRKDIPAIAKAANGAVVSIIMSDKDGHPIAQGSGFLISRDGRIVTNYHVIQNGSSAIAKLPDGAFFVVDGVLAFDKARDVAIIKAHGQNFRTVILGNSDRLQVGEEIVAIGNPLSLESSVSNGLVSGIRTVKEEGGEFLQITAPISPGSSGGPLFNMAGEVVGITTLYIRGGENLNFAIPINDVKPMLEGTVTPSSKLFICCFGFPNEPKEEGKAPIEENQPTTGREYFQELRDSGGISPDYDHVCFDATPSGAFLLVALRGNAINRGVLLGAFYDNGVQTRKSAFEWNPGTHAWEDEISPPADLNAYVTTKKFYQLSIEPTTLRYNLSSRVTITAGKGDTQESDSRTYHLGSGICEGISSQARR
jgi:S1-C subfamily serine protease